MTTPTPAPPRALAPDLARGTMLLFIALANTPYHLWGGGHDTLSAHPTGGTHADQITRAAIAIAVDLRVYPMFAFLFGYGMVQFARSRAARGFDERGVRTMLRRRHWAMIGFGFVHAALLFAGDVLGAYGLAGLVLVALFFRRRDKTVAIWAGVFALVLAGFAASMVAGGLFLAGSGDATASADWGAAAVGGSPDYLATIPARLAFWAFITPGQGLVGMAVPVAILLGWLAARHRVLEEPRRHRRLLWPTAVLGIAVAWLGALPDGLHQVGVRVAPPEAPWMFVGVAMLTGVAGGLGYAAAIGLIAAHVGEVLGWFGRAVEAVGRRSLTFYLLQSIVLAPLMSAWGLGVGAHVNSLAAALIATAVWCGSLPLALALARRGARGPFEAVLRRLTYGRVTPVAGARSASPA